MRTKVLESIHGRISKKKKSVSGGRSFVLIFLKEWGHGCPWERGPCENDRTEESFFRKRISIYRGSCKW